MIRICEVRRGRCITKFLCKIGGEAWRGCLGTQEFVIDDELDQSTKGCIDRPIRVYASSSSLHQNFQQRFSFRPAVAPIPIGYFGGGSLQ